MSQSMLTLRPLGQSSGAAGHSVQRHRDQQPADTGNWSPFMTAERPVSSSGTMSLTSSPSLTGTARLFANQFNDFGGERYSVQFDDNSSAQNFFYDAWVYIAGSADGFPISNSISIRRCRAANRRSWDSSATAGFNDGTMQSTAVRPPARTTLGCTPMLPAMCIAGDRISGITCRSTSRITIRVGHIPLCLA